MFKSNNIVIYILPFIALMVMLLCIKFLPINFNTTNLNYFWYSLSASAGIAGSILWVLTISLFGIVGKKPKKQKLLAFGSIILIMSGTAIGIAAFNENIVKSNMSVPRPSHLLLNQHHIIPDLDKFYELDKEERRSFLELHFNNNSIINLNIPDYMAKHWIYESGYSFPSGHTQNAFLFGVIFYFLLLKFIKNPLSYMLCLIPLIWSVMVGISRVSLYVHTIDDVVAGGFSGIIIGYVVLWILGKLELIGNPAY